MRSAWTIRIGLLAISTCACLGNSAVTQAQVPADYFRQNCTVCHTVGKGRLIGPDLEGVTKRKDRAWLVKFLQSPQAMIDSGDPYTAQLLKDAHGLVMPNVAGMTPDMASALLDLIEGAPSPAKSELAGVVISDRPFTASDIAIGEQFFRGERPLANGGPACISCHTLGTIGGLGGGRLGPDLTQAFDRLGGRKGLGAWLSAPPTQTMQSVFRNHALQPKEILPLLAVIDDASKRSRPADTSSMAKFVLFGFSGMLVGLALLQFAWRGRFRSVRRTIVRAQVRGEQ
jgi:cytochrome c2